MHRPFASRFLFTSKMRTISFLALAVPAAAFMAPAPMTERSLKMSAQPEPSTKPAGLSVGALAKGFATASMLFNFAAMPLTSMPEAAAAKAGDGPRQSIFGLGGDATSLPFVTDTKTFSPYSPYGTGDQALFKPLNDDDVKFYTGKVMESKKRVDKIEGYLAKKQWPEIQSELTRQMYDLRRSAQKLADAKQSPEARNALKAMFQDIESLNVAARRKQMELAQESYGKAQADFAAFLKAI